MGKSQSAKQQVVDYFMSIHLGVCLSADAVLGVYVNDREAWSGHSTNMEVLPVNKPDLFGGPKKEGGLVGSIYHLPGRDDQVLPAEVASRFGKTPTTAPGFRQITSLLFYGSTSLVSAQSGLFGGSFGQILLGRLADTGYAGGQGGFNWSSNNPMIAQKIAVKLQRASKTGLNPAYKMIGSDSNGAHMIYECLTDTDWGMGAPTSTIDHASFDAAALTLFNESFGLSMIWTRQTEIEKFVGEINDHIQGMLFLHPRSGLWTLKLIRDDYDLLSLRAISPDNADLTNFERRMWGEVANEVTVSWTNPANEQDETVTAQDLAANFIQGSPVSISRNFYGVRNATLAMALAQREVRASSAALATCSATIDRHGWDILPGGVLIVTWPKYQLNGVVMRVGNVDYGDPGDSKITVSLMEDIFSLEKPPINVPPSTAWETPGSLPAPMAAMEILTIPSYFALSGDFQSAAIDLKYPEVIAGVFGYQSDPDTSSFELMAQGVSSTGEASFYPAGTKTVVERTILAVPLAQAVESRISDVTVINKRRGPRVGGFVWLGAGSDANMEIGQVTEFDEDTQEWVISRGVLDTTPRPWPAGTPVWFVNPGTRIADDRTIRSAGAEVDYRLLSRTSRGVLPLADAPTISEVLTPRPHMPLRPANVKINGQAWGNVAAGGALHITWATRNRFLEDGQVVPWDAGPIPPEYAQGTVIRVVAPGGAIVYEQKLWLDQEVTLQSSWFDRWAEVRIYVWSRRDDLDSLQSHSIGVTGLAGNPGAPAPPVPPDPGPPPQLGAAPAVGAWTAIGYAFEQSADGKVIGSVPAILVSGVRDRPDAIGLIVRYALKDTTDWFVLPSIAINDAPAQAATTAVKPQTIYVVEVAYVDADGSMSAWRALGEVLTGALTAGALGDLTYQQVKDAIDFLEEIGAEGQTLQETFAEIISGVNLTAESVLAEILRDSDDKSRFEKLLHLPDGKTIGNVLATEIEQRESEKEAYNFKFDVMGSLGTDGNSWIFNAQKTFWAPGKSFASIDQQIISTVDTSVATVKQLIETNVTATEATARALTVLGSLNAEGNAFNIRLDRTYAGNGQLLAEYVDGVSSTAATGAASWALTQAKSYVVKDSPFAQVMRELGVSTPSGFLARITETQQVSEAGVFVGLRLQYGNKVTGYVMTNTGEQGDVVWLQDKFIISSPTGNIIPFVVDTTTGKTQMQDVEARNIAADVITAREVRANNLARTHRVFTLGDQPLPGGGGNVVGELVVPDFSGGLMMFDVYINARATSGGSNTVKYMLIAYDAAGTQIGYIGNPNGFGSEITGFQAYNGAPFKAFWRPAAGSYRFKIFAYRTNTDGSQIVVDNVVILITDEKTQT